jgi:post-segregation antitoxin (ccd killing protein)
MTTPESSKKSKATIYLPNELLKSLKKHAIDLDATLSSVIEDAVRSKLKHDASRSGRKKILSRKKASELDEIISDIATA